MQWPVTEEQLLAPFIAKGMKLTPAVKSIAKLIPQLKSRAELEDFVRWTRIEELAYENPSQQRRRELLREFESCPCCGGWLGHNKPPSDDADPSPSYRRQTSFDLK